MLEYFQIGVCVFLLWAICLAFLKTAPARIKFYLTMAALCVWLVPWHYLAIEISGLASSPLSDLKMRNINDIDGLFADLESIYPARPNYIRIGPPTEGNSLAAKLDNSVEQAFLSQTFAFLAEHKNWVGFSALLIGIALFVFDLVKYSSACRRWRRRSRCGNHYALGLGLDLGRARIRLLDGPTPGMATGLAKPIIWISSEIKNSQTIRAVLAHELTHIRHHDNLWVWLIGLTKRLFWWNPIVWLLANKARDYIEYSCDEACNQDQSIADYAYSLTQLVIKKDQIDSSQTILGIYKTSNFNVLRVQALLTHRQLNVLHQSVLCGFALCAVGFSLLFANDTTDTFNTQAAPSDFVKSPVSQIEVAGLRGAFFEVTELIQRGDFDAATGVYDDTVAALEASGNFDAAIRAYAFRVNAAILGDTGKYSEILENFDEILTPKMAVLDVNVNRVLVITHIKLKQYEKALELLKAADEPYFRAGPSVVFLAQTYHLMGDYRRSNLAIERGLPYLSASVYFDTKIAALRLYGKNLEILGDNEGLASVRQELGTHAPDDFREVRADTQKIPYVYFFYKSIAGTDVEAVDRSLLPLPNKRPVSAEPRVQALIDGAFTFAKDANYIRAINYLEDEIENLPLMIDKNERAKALEYLFTLQLTAGMDMKSIPVARELAQIENLRPSIRARIHYALSVSVGGKLSEQRLRHFEKYLDIHSEKNITVDHEILKIYSNTIDSGLANEALERIVAFYEANETVPDIRVVNRIISRLEYMNKIEQAAEYRELLAINYPRAYNFIYE